MRRTGIGLLFGALLLSVVAFSDEPASKSGVQKQRVSPKLLKEALALPELADRTQPVPPVSLDDLKRLAARLKSSGNVDDAELLQRFVREHEQFTTRVHAYPGAQDETFNVQCHVLDIKVGDLPPHCITDECGCVTHNKDLQAELDRLVKENKAKCVIESLQIPVKAHETARARSDRESPASIASSDGSVHSPHEPGTIVEISVIPMTKELLKLQITTETTAKSPETVTTLAGANVSGITKRKTQSTIEVHPGDSVVQTSPTTVNGHRQLVLVKVHSKK